MIDRYGALGDSLFLVGEGHSLQRRDYAIAIILFLVSCCVFSLTFSPMPASDGLTTAIRIQTGDPVGLFRAAKLLYQPMGHLLYRLCQSIGPAVPPIQLLQAVNALVGSSIISGFSLLLFRLFGDRLAAIIGATLLAFSHSFWFYLNGEVHVFSVACLLVAAWALLAMELQRISTWILAGVMHGLAILFHLDNIGFGGLVLTVSLISPLMKGRRLKLLVVYACALIVVVAVPYCLAGYILSPDIPPWSYWYNALLREVVRDSQFIGVSSTFAPIYNLVRLAKGQGTALTIGVDTLADLARNHSEYAFTPHLLVLLVMTAGIVTIFATILVRAWCQRKTLWHSFRSLIVFCVAWIVSLEIIHYFWTPSTDEYHVTTLPPLIILLIMGLITRSQGEQWRLRSGLALLGWFLALLVFANELVGIVLPWKRFGDSLLQTAGQVQEISEENALFITPDSSVALDYFAGREVRRLKFDLYEGLDAGLNELGKTIDDALKEERQVFLFRWLRPSEFFFDDYNQRNQANLTPEEFAQEFQIWAANRYILIPVLHYWEWEFRYEMYGNRDAIIYRVEPLSTDHTP